MAGDDFTIEAFTLLGIAIVTIAIRIAARWITAGPRNFQLDDFLMPLAGVVYGLESGAAYCVGAWWMGLANNSMTDEQRATLSPTSEEYRLRVGGSKTQVLGWSLYTTLLWLLKACMAIFYSRLTSGLINMHRRVQIAYVLIGVTYIAVICSILFGCHPMHKNWQIYPDPGNYCQPAVSHIDVYVTVTLNVATDVYLISIPTPMLFKARLPWREKLELLVLFSGGIFVMAAGILRCVLIVTVRLPSPTLSLTPRPQIPPKLPNTSSPPNTLTMNKKAGANGAQQAGSWACRETFVAVIIGNAPMIYPLCRRIARRAGWYISTKGASANSYPLTDTGGLNSKSTMHSSNRKRKFKHPLSLPDTQYHDEQTILPGSQPTICEAGTWDEESRGSQEGIKVVRETIVRSQ
ncbi:hypothetical protein BDV34DRAFT_220379 [Aspergillus parasiticus]|uniref:Rhodopsin domain-containing protein n=1 Tax=Aspergillus parasiticus TaxID=5067 RepID=A0A5N6E0J8_ASPPA|nr:hypothetical protein BDV34DRAFT_220379 [Aspergillus parasiticus]